MGRPMTSGVEGEERVAASPDRQPLDVPLLPAEDAWQRRVEQLTWALVALGVTVRLVRFGLRFPLWGDEYALAVNFLDRGYLDLLRPLNCHQVAPLLFLWAELSAVKLLGFSEYSLRLVPTIASVAGLIAFRGLAARLLRGWPLLLAVGILAVAHYPIRHGAEVKPYAVDLCVSVVLLRLAVESWRRPDQSRWLWLLMLVVPLGLGLSYPAVFVAGGVSIALAVDLWRTRRWGAMLPFAAYNLALCAAFLGLFVWATRGQYAAEQGVMTDYWGDAFPPLAQPLRLPLWLVATHTGEMFAYPVGAERGGSVLTFLCFVAGGVALVRRGRGWLALACLAPFGLGLVAAALERYPYGGHPRLMQYLAPMICLLAGLGGAVLLELFRGEQARKAVLAASTVVLALMGVGILVRELAKPYQVAGDEEIRGLAETFWRSMERDGQVVCVETELGQSLHRGRNDNRFFGNYRCLREIYDPRLRARGGMPAAGLDERQPVACVVYDQSGLKRDEPALTRWLAAMQTRYDLAGKEQHQIDVGGPNGLVRYEVYRFLPRGVGQPTDSQARNAAATTPTAADNSGPRRE